MLLFTSFMKLAYRDYRFNSWAGSFEAGFPMVWALLTSSENCGKLLNILIYKENVTNRISQTECHKQPTIAAVDCPNLYIEYATNLYILATTKASYVTSVQSFCKQRFNISGDVCLPTDFRLFYFYLIFVVFTFLIFCSPVYLNCVQVNIVFTSADLFCIFFLFLFIYSLREY